MKRRNGKTKKAGKNAPASKTPEPTSACSTRLLSAVLLLALAVMIGVVLTVLESVKAAVLGRFA